MLGSASLEVWTWAYLHHDPLLSFSGLGEGSLALPGLILMDHGHAGVKLSLSVPVYISGSCLVSCQTGVFYTPYTPHTDWRPSCGSCFRSTGGLGFADRLGNTPPPHSVAPLSLFFFLATSSVPCSYFPPSAFRFPVFPLRPPIQGWVLPHLSSLFSPLFLPMGIEPRSLNFLGKHSSTD